jgi:hypothetical protein
LWINIPITRPAAPPNAPAMTARLTRTMYGPPVSMTVPVSPPIASNSQMSRRPATIPTDSGTQVASAARTIAPHGTGAGLGRTAAVSQSGIASASRPGTTASRSRAVRSCRFVTGPSLPGDLLPGAFSWARFNSTGSRQVFRRAW